MNNLKIQNLLQFSIIKGKSYYLQQKFTNKNTAIERELKLTERTDDYIPRIKI